MLRFSFLSLVALLAFSMTAPAARAETTIAVVDMQQILSESDAAKSILAQLKTQRDVMEKEIKTLEDGLKAYEKALLQKRKDMKPEDFAKEGKAFEQKVMESRAKVQKSRNAADAAFNKAIGELRKNLIDVVAELSTEQKIQLVITKQNVIVGENKLEITNEVMKRLNAKVKTIKVTIQK